MASTVTAAAVAAASTPALTQEYIDAYSGGKVIGLAIAYIPILLIFVGLRFWSKHLSRANIGLDDYLAILSLGIQLTLSALAICFVKYGGVGRHFSAWAVIDPAKQTLYFQWLLCVAFFYFFCVPYPKLSILAFYHRIFHQRPYRILIYMLAFIVEANGIVTPIISLNMCHPFKYNWDRTIPGGHCWDEQSFYRWASLPNIVTDIIMLILPLPVVWKLQTSINTKLELTAAFALGSLGLATSIIRFASFFHGSAVQDGTWGSVDLMIWTMTEPNVYLICACLLTFRPLVNRYLKKPDSKNKAVKLGYKYGGGGSNTVRNAIRRATARQDLESTQLSALGDIHVMREYQVDICQQRSLSSG